MLRNYLLTAFRHLWRHRVFSILNIAGLTIGMSACFLVFLYVRFELSYDGFHSKGDRIYRMVCDIKTPNGNLPVDITSPPMAINIRQAFPEIENFVRFWPQSILFRKGDIKFQESHMAFTDSTFFSLFDFPLLRGNPATALRDPWNVVLSETAAKRYFGKQDPIGQHLILTDGNNIGTVTGVMKDMPENTLLKADALVALSTFKSGDSTYDKDWENFGVYSYLLLRPRADAGALEKKFPAFLESRIGSEMRKNQQHYRLSLEPLKDVYLRSDRSSLEKGSIHDVYILSIIGGFILLIAAINFVNLTTARSTERAREVGIRKVIGAGRVQLTGQFLGESLVLAFLAFMLSTLLCALMIPAFNGLA
ncbi:MAG TPA: ABC transporter permease, partial [Puia sp.]|nr:ABC transporter permease [Puia sp.]